MSKHPTNLKENEKHDEMQIPSNQMRVVKWWAQEAYNKKDLWFLSVHKIQILIIIPNHHKTVKDIINLKYINWCKFKK